MDINESYEVLIGTYEDAGRNLTELYVVVEFEEDPECGLCANYYLTTEEADREFFDHTLYKKKEAPDASTDAWMQQSINRVEADLDAGMFSLEAVTNWIEKRLKLHEARSQSE